MLVEHTALAELKQARRFQAEQRDTELQIWYGLGEEKKEEFSTLTLLEATVTLYSFRLKSLLIPIKCGIF